VYIYNVRPSIDDEHNELKPPLGGNDVTQQKTYDELRGEIPRG